jgi:hypothetical protein
MTVPAGLGRDELIERAKVYAANYINGKRVVKAIVVPDKLVNLVLAG